MANIKIKGQSVHLAIYFEYVSTTTRRMGRLPTQWWGWISNASSCKSWIAKRMFGRLSIYDKSGVLALETKAPIGKQYLVCIDFHNRNNSQN